MNPPRHVMILASAGSGKTHALTNRYIALLAAGAAPERIVALTFTRKAAGEFFDEILKKLAGAASEPAAAAQLAEQISRDNPGLGHSPLAPADFLRLLRAMVDAMPRLCLGTLDSFFARVVRCFPLELGLDGEFTLLEGEAARRERRRVLARLFTTSEGGPSAAQREFIEAFKRATFGTEEKQLAARLERFLDEHAETFLDAPQAECWGNAARIWPGECEWLKAVPGRAVATTDLRASLPWAALNDKQRKRLDDFFAALPEWAPGAPLPQPVSYLVENAFKVWEELCAGRAELTLSSKKVPLAPACCAALRAVVAGICGAELERRLAMTSGIYEVMHHYEAGYHDAVRRGGRLTFADVTRLLLPAAGAPELSSAGHASAEDTAERRLLLDWRLDAQFDHWLLDEFQDTSFAQWSVLRNLVDEAVQDAEGRRSFFYVGDVKQAIYAWRHGDARLFREIFNYYNTAAPETIAEQHLTQSWRSGPPVIAMVNRVHGDAAALRALVPEEAAARWSREWREHSSARPQLGGYAELRHADDEEGRFAETLKILREVEPRARGLGVAVLVQKNDTATELADYLRREGGLAATAESDRQVAVDNPLTCALLALLRLAAHPGDTLAREHLRMTPAGGVLAEAGNATPEILTTQMLEELHDKGFAGTLAHWLRRLEPQLRADDEFSRLRGRQLVALAREFDADGRRDVAEFLARAEAQVARDQDAAGVVRVMTIHKAKGLGFDLVILPDLEGQTLARRRAGLAVHQAADRAVEWILDPPAALMTEHDPVLAAHLAGEKADAAYESLCKLYVAMTRAKRALYVITTPPKSKSTSNNFPKLLQETLGETWSEGDARWYADLPRHDEAARSASEGDGRDARPELRPLRGAAGVARLVAQRPSDEPRGTVDGAALFVLERAAPGEFGTVVHRLLAEVEWLAPGDPERLALAWKARGADPKAVDVALACVAAPALAGLWARPAGPAEVWRERAFEIVDDQDWVSGVFDRVVVDRASGRATVFDFKTGAAPVAALFAGQLAVYRRAVARLAGLPEAAVRAELVFTANRTRVVME